jgi:tryptophan-rich sensory protein
MSDTINIMNQNASIPATEKQTVQLNNFSSQYKDMTFWAFIIIAIIVLIIIFLVIRTGLELYNRTSKKGWADANSVWGIVIIVVTLLFSYGSYRAYSLAPDDMYRQFIAVSFGVQMILLLIIFYLIFRTFSFRNAFYLSILTFILSVVHLYFAWKIDRGAGYASILYVVWVLIMLFGTWGLSSDNQGVNPENHHHNHHHNDMDLP